MTRQIVFTIPEAAKTIGVSEVTLGKATTHLERLGIVAETTGRARNRVYVYDNYLRLLQDDEPVAFA